MGKVGTCLVPRLVGLISRNYISQNSKLSYNSSRSLADPRDLKYQTHVLSGITFIFIPDKEPKYRTVRSNTGHLATLQIVAGRQSRDSITKGIGLDYDKFRV